MVKLIITGRRRPGMTRAGLSHHLRHVHGPMVTAPPPDAGPMPTGYVQNHVRDGAYPPGGVQPGVERDFVTEVWFDTPDAARASVATPYYRSVLQPDEPRFVDLETVRRCFAVETTVKEGQATPHKAFLFWSVPPGLNPASFQQAWPAARPAAHPSVRRWVANETGAMPGPAPLPYDGIDAIWLVPGADPQPLHEAMLQTLAAHIDPAGCFFVTVEEFTTQRLRQA